MKIDQQLKALCEEYAAELPGKLARMQSEWDRFRAQSDSDLLQIIIRNLHNLAGSGTTFGYAEISQTAAKLESLLRDHEADSSALPALHENVEQFFSALENAARRPPSYNGMEDAPQPLMSATPAQNAAPSVLLIADNADRYTGLINKLSLYDIETHVSNRTAGLQHVLETTRPDCVLLEISSPHQRIEEMTALSEFRQSHFESPALIILSDQDDMPTRLAAVRGGAMAYFTEPANLTELVKLILIQCKIESSPPLRIMIIDDDVQFAHHIALQLQRAGMETQVITEPMKVLEPLSSFKPELILLDLHMPGCSGLELATIIRQHFLYTGIAIVFFSVETDIDRHIDALRSGANEFFVKGLPPRQLVAKVEAKARLARDVQNLMMNDALTGLANRTHFTEIIGRLFAASQRYQRCFAYVILDIDHFKRVNDRFGHQSGDKVLKTLGSILLQRLRSVDTAIRYGGEEIVILLPETTALQAGVIVNEVQKKLGAMTFSAGKQQFSVTFSAGIAEYPFFNSLSKLFEAADKALYSAKAAGRNRVCLADH